MAGIEQKEEDSNKSFLDRIDEFLSGIRLSPVILILVLTAFSLLVLLLIGDYSPVEVIDVAINAILTLGLLLVYTHMAKSQKGMEEIEARQRDLMEYQNAPNLNLEGLYFNHQSLQDYFLKLTIHNIAGIPTKDLTIEVEPKLMRWEQQNGELTPALQNRNSGLETLVPVLTRERDLNSEPSVPIGGEDADDDDFNVTLGKELDPGQSATYKFELNFKVKENGNGYFQVAKNESDGLRPYEFLTAASLLEKKMAEGEEAVLRHSDKNGQTYYGDGESEYFPDVPFDRLLLEFDIKSHGEVVESAKIVLPIKLPHKDRAREKWMERSKDMWEFALPYSIYQNIDQLEIAGNYPENADYDSDLDPIANKSEGYDIYLK